jgi:starch phosphorylase
VSLVEEGADKHVRMAHLAIVGSHSTNGVAAIHSELLRTQTVKDLAEMFPERFSNKTNGVTPRRWLALAIRRSPRRSPRPSGRMDHRPRASPQAGAAGRRSGISRRLPQGQARGQGAFLRWLEATTGQTVDPDRIFDCQVKRIHEYKRQLLNALRIVVLYQRLRENPNLEMTPRTFFFAGKAAPPTIWRSSSSSSSTIWRSPSRETRPHGTDCRCSFCPSTTCPWRSA